eukprot:5155873-Prymnesium_polylepis.2
MSSSCGVAGRHDLVRGGGGGVGSSATRLLTSAPKVTAAAESACPGVSLTPDVDAPKGLSLIHI